MLFRGKQTTLASPSTTPLQTTVVSYRVLLPFFALIVVGIKKLMFDIDSVKYSPFVFGFSEHQIRLKTKNLYFRQENNLPNQIFQEIREKTLFSSCNV